MRYLLILLLSGCANSGAWSDKPVRPPVSALFTVHVDFPCGVKPDGIRRVYGCWNEAARTVEIKKGLSAEDEQCVRDHEDTGKKSHTKGYTHGDQGHYLRMDCGET